ncbi:MAG: helix-turn-helix domain-containing protein, partial [archaeon]
MSDKNELFSEFGLTGNEGKIFEVLLTNSPITGASVATKLGINKSVAYFVLDQLVQKGFASYVVINKRKEYRAIDSTMLKLKLEERKNEFLKKYGDITSIISQATQKKKKRALISIYNGWDGIKTAFGDILSSTNRGEEYFVFSVNLSDNTLPRFRRFIRNFHAQRAAKGIECSILVDNHLKDTIGSDREKDPHTQV